MGKDLPLRRLAVKNVGLEAARAAATKKSGDVKFEPKGNNSLSRPKHGKDDPKNEPHQGGNQWAGGVRSFESSCAYMDLTPTHRLVEGTPQDLGVEEAIKGCSKTMRSSKSRIR